MDKDNQLTGGKVIRVKSASLKGGQGEYVNKIKVIEWSGPLTVPTDGVLLQQIIFIILKSNFLFYIFKSALYR